MKGIVTQGIVLARTNYQEADRILTILTPDNGKIRVIAKGVRKSKSKLAAGIELFSVSHITFIPPKKEIGTLISSRLDVHFGSIVTDMERTTFAYDLLKWMNKLTEDAASQEYFDLAKHALAALNITELNLDMIRLWFDAQLLKITGHSPNLKTDETGQQLSQDAMYTFDFETMTFAEHKAGMFGSEHLKLLRVVLGANNAEKLVNIQGIEKVLPSCLQLADAMRRQHLHI